MEKQEFSANDRTRHFMTPHHLKLHAKNQKKITKRFLEKSKKPQIWAILTIFGHAQGVQFFFSKIGRRHELDIMAIDLHTKNQKKIMNGFGENAAHARTHARTDGQA